MEKDFVKRAFLFTTSGGILLGVFWASYISKFLWDILFGVSLFVFLGVFLWIKKEKQIFFIILFIFIGALFGFARFIQVDTPVSEIIKNKNEQKVELVGTVSRDPEDRQGRREYVIDNVSFIENGERQNVEGKILVRAARVPKFGYGDIISFEGTISMPEAFITDTGRLFDYEGYLRKDGIVSTLSFANGEYVGEGKKNFIKDILFKIKHVYLENINQVVPVPESILAGGLLLGERGSFSNELTQDFRRAGLIHIVVLSGYNIAIISEYTLLVFRKRFRKKIALTLAGFFIVLFAFLVGGEATVVRASIMGLLVLLARGGSRRYNITRALVFASILMILHNPLILALDISFQLSVLATAALIYIAPIIERYMTWLPEKFGIREAGTATLSTQIFVLPYLVYRMGEISVIAPIVNILVLPIIPLTMLFAFIVGIAGVPWGGLAYMFSFILTPLLSYVIWMTEFFAGLPFASFTLPEINFVFVIMLYVLIIYGVRKISNQKPSKEISFEGSDEYEIVEYEIVKN